MVGVFFSSVYFFRTGSGSLFPSMKTSIIAMVVLALASMNVIAQSSTQLAVPTQATGTNVPAPTPYQAVDSGPNHTVWQRLTYEVAANGKIVSHVHQYTELATGLHYWSDVTSLFRAT